MPILKSFRRLFGANQPVEIDISGSTPPTTGEVSDALAPLTDPGPSVIDAFEALGRVESAIESGRRIQDQALRSIEAIPRAVTELERVGSGQTDLIEAVRELGTNQERRAEAESAVLSRLADLLDRESALFGLVQQQLDANHQLAEETAKRLDQLGSSLHETARTNRATAEAMEALTSDLRTREQRSEERAGVMQGWIVTCVVACIAATVASIALAWAVLGSSG
jgi:type I site-specific restriction endonuclease